MMKLFSLLLYIFVLGFVLGGCLPEDVDSHVGHIRKIEVATSWDPVGGDELDGYYVVFKDGYKVHVQPYVFDCEENELIVNRKYVGLYGRFIDDEWGSISWKTLLKPKPKSHHSWE